MLVGYAVAALGIAALVGYDAVAAGMSAPSPAALLGPAPRKPSARIR
jgi:hypothetical protein